MLRVGTLKSAAEALAYWSGVAGAAQRRMECARVVIFHGTPHDRAAELERQLRYLLRHFTVVDLGELVRRMDGGPGSLRRLVTVTFDDGIRNNVTVAYPILQRLGVPATFFVCPGLIESGKWLWNCEARQRLRHAPAGVRRELARQYGIDADVERIVGWMKTLDMAARRHVEAEIRTATPRYVPSALERHALDLADWDLLRSLDPALITLASHTLHHPILTCMTAEEVQSELCESRRILEERLQRPVEALAYPNGDHSPLVREIARQHYHVAFADGDALVENTARRHAIPRFTAPTGALRLALRANRLAGQSAPSADAPGAEPVAAH